MTNTAEPTLDVLLKQQQAALQTARAFLPPQEVEPFERAERKVLELLNHSKTLEERVLLLLQGFERTCETEDELFRHVPLSRHDFTEALTQAKCEGYVDEPWDKTWNILTETGAARRNRSREGTRS